MRAQGGPEAEMRARKHASKGGHPKQEREENRGSKQGGHFRSLMGEPGCGAHGEEAPQGAH